MRPRYCLSLVGLLATTAVPALAADTPAEALLKQVTVYRSWAGPLQADVLFTKVGRDVRWSQGGTLTQWRRNTYSIGASPFAWQWQSTMPQGGEIGYWQVGQAKSQWDRLTAPRPATYGDCWRSEPMMALATGPTALQALASRGVLSLLAPEEVDGTVCQVLEHVVQGRTGGDEPKISIRRVYIDSSYRVRKYVLEIRTRSGVDRQVAEMSNLRFGSDIIQEPTGMQYDRLRAGRASGDGIWL